MSIHSDSGHHIVIYTGSDFILMNVTAIMYCESYEHYTKLYGQDSVTIGYGCLKTYEMKLKEYGFIRTHDGYLVNPLYITRFPSKSSDNQIFLTNGAILEVSRRKKKEAYEKWKQFHEGKL